MELKTLLLEQIKRENEYLRKQQVGTEDYVNSMYRINELESKLAEVEQFESDAARKDKQWKEEMTDRTIKNIIEGVKTASGFVMPMIGLFVILKWEETGSITTALRGYVNNFIPKKLL